MDGRQSEDSKRDPLSSAFGGDGAGSDDLFRLLFQKNPNPMWLYERESLRILRVNEAMVELYGWSADELTAMSLLDIRPPEEVERLLRNLKTPQQRLHKGHWRHRTKDGRPLDVMIASYAIELQGRSCALVVATDIGELIRAERALVESEARLRQAQRLARMGDWIWYPGPGEEQWREGRAEYSEEAAALFGVTPKELELSNQSYIERFVHPDDRAAVGAVFYDLVQPFNKGYRQKYRILRADGAVRTVQEIAENVVDAEGRLLATRGTIQDITEQEQLEAQLQQAQKMEALGQLTGGVAHDFNNLLTVIMGNVELLREQLGQERPALAALGEVALSAAQRAAALTRRLLTFARQTPLQAEAIALPRLFAEIEPLLRRVLGPDQTLAIDLPADLPAIQTDRNQLENAIINLIANARDAMGERGRLRVHAENLRLDSAAALGDLAPGSYVRLGISDDGCGMTPEVASHAFEPFYTTKGPGKGSGLGLSTVYGFARQSGGAAAIETLPGRGTTVWLTLPQAGAVRSPAPAAEPGGDESPTGGSVVLVVEDDPGIRRLALAQLGQLGYRTLEAANGLAAEGILRSDEPIDLMLSDVVMPGGVGGLDLVRLARQIRPGMKCLLMSGYAEDALADDGGATVVPFLAKPFRRQGLADAVRGALEGDGPADLRRTGT